MNSKLVGIVTALASVPAVAAQVDAGALDTRYQGIAEQIVSRVRVIESKIPESGRVGKYIKEPIDSSWPTAVKIGIQNRLSRELGANYRVTRFKFGSRPSNVQECYLIWYEPNVSIKNY